MIEIDWVIEAVDDILRQQDRLHSSLGSGLIASELIEVINKHCTFKPDVAYMPVPRCETCAHGDRDVSDNNLGVCCLPIAESQQPLDTEYHMWPSYRDDIITIASFGCVQWKEKA